MASKNKEQKLHDECISHSKIMSYNLQYFCTKKT